jgi:hypothetical protein
LCAASGPDIEEPRLHTTFEEIVDKALGIGKEEEHELDDEQELSDNEDDLSGTHLQMLF